jgi:hypothetical protein
MNRAPSPTLFSIYLLTILVILSQLAWPPHLFSLERVSVKKYPQKALPLSNPVDLTQLPRNETFQITHPRFILQFFFSGPNIMGIIMKRDPRFPIRLRWCFFRDCSESRFDYNVTIADSYAPPLANDFFEIKFPPQLRYHFQGLYFYAGW